MAYPPIIVLAAIMCGSAVSISAMGFVSRYLAQRRMAKLESTSRDELAQRLDRIEQGMDAIATEVERLGETNRYVAKLLADKANALPGHDSGEPPNVP
ncbi:MAG TPA: hypothetical protein VH762_04570 [Gemmatimonadaceae bacterium]|jgi:hypothetical protein